MKKIGPSLVLLGALLLVALQRLGGDALPKPDWRRDMAQDLFEGRARLTGTVWYTNVGPDRVCVTFEFAKP